VKGAAVFFQQENPISENEIAIESKINTESMIESNHNPKSNPIMEKVKYTDSRTQRAFYYDKHLIKIFDKEYPKSKYNKSEIMNELLRNFLIENGKL
jgi:hypothetical protein